MGSSFSALPASETTVVTSAVVPGFATWVIYWVIFGVMAGAALLFAFLTWRKPMYERGHGYLTTLIVTVAATAYFSMACHGGDSYIPLYWNRSEARDVFWARYIDWFVTTPLLLLDLLMLAGVPVGTFLWVAVADILMIVFGLFGAITSWRFRWGYYAIGCFFMFVVFWGMFVTGPRYALRRSKRLAGVYTGLTAYLMVLFCGYPIVWGLAEGDNVITPAAEAAAYGGLDVCAKAIFGFLMLVAAHPVIASTLAEERGKGVHDMSLLEAPVTAPLSGVRQRLPYNMDNAACATCGPNTAHTVDNATVVVDAREVVPTTTAARV